MNTAFPEKTRRELSAYGVQDSLHKHREIIRSPRGNETLIDNHRLIDEIGP